MEKETTSHDQQEEEEEEEGSAEQEASDHRAQLAKKLSEVARRRTMRRNTLQGRVQRIRNALEKGDGAELGLQLVCEIADSVLMKLQVFLNDSPTWAAMIDGAYKPGTTSNRDVDQERWGKCMNTFIQLVCGWPSLSCAFGPLEVLPNSKLVGVSGIRAGEQIFGTVTIKQTVETQINRGLPRGKVTDAMRGLLHVLVMKDDEQLKGAAMNPVKAASFSKVLDRAIANIDRVELGDGGTPKRPNEYQMQVVQRINTTVIQGLTELQNAVESLL